MNFARFRSILIEILIHNICTEYIRLSNTYVPQMKSRMVDFSFRSILKYVRYVKYCYHNAVNVNTLYLYTHMYV